MTFFYDAAQTNLNLAVSGNMAKLLLFSKELSYIQ